MTGRDYNKRELQKGVRWEIATMWLPLHTKTSGGTDDPSAFYEKASHLEQDGYFGRPPSFSCS
jgi:hypothetical protein